MKKIIEGIINSLTGQEKELAEERISVCLKPDEGFDHCSFYNKESILGPKCDACGCVLKYKIKSPDSKCPKDKWKR